MAKDKNDRLKHLYIIVATFLLVAGAFNWVYGHFAKTSVVEKLAVTVEKGLSFVEERLAIGTHDDRVHRQKEAVESAKNRVRFKENDDEPTTRELEDVLMQEARLEEVKQERAELIEQYKSKK